MLIGGTLGYRLLRYVKPMRVEAESTEPELSYVPKLTRILGEEAWEKLREKTVVDFGCGIGVGALEMARHGAQHVIGLDIRPQVLQRARRSALAEGLQDRCSFVETLPSDVKADMIVSVDAFEHFDDPAGVLRTMHSLLSDDGCVVLSFGPTWYHPKGGHLFSVFPWSHLVFTESSQIRWRSDFKHDGAKRFGEVEGGLNQITIREFLRIVRESDFEVESFRPVPIRPLRWMHSRWTREFTTAVVDCKLVKKR